MARSAPVATSIARLDDPLMEFDPTIEADDGAPREIDSQRQRVTDEPILAELVETPALVPPRAAAARSRSARYSLPVLLFALTCVTTFWAGCAGFAWYEAEWFSWELVERLVRANWVNGLVYMAAVVSILLAHEMGHFLQAVRYRVPTSLPYFIPMPITHIGTMGAVIAMRGGKANRRELFDIGISGPLAGLVVAVPVLMLGLYWAEPAAWRPPPMLEIPPPLALRALAAWIRPELPLASETILHPLLLAGWVGLFVTGLNMLPVSQLDGGHVAYTLFGRGAHWLARGFIVAALAYILWMGHYSWIAMILIILFIGIRHPPTSNDRMRLGWPRAILGFVSLAIPLACLVPAPVVVNEPALAARVAHGEVNREGHPGDHQRSTRIDAKASDF